MAFSFGDGFDLYAANLDAYQNYWDSGTGVVTFPAGRFSGSQALQAGASATVILAKSSGQNDAVHHLVVAFRQSTTLTGTNACMYLQLLDGTTGQVCVVFRSDGAILLTSGTFGGTTLATYTGAFPFSNVWYAFEFEIIINNTTGRFRVRKNGNTSDDFDSGAVLNTRPGTNSYANKLQVAVNSTANTQQIDDLFWRSDASSVAWLGDIRCQTRMPASDVGSVQFSRTPTGSALIQTSTGGSSSTGFFNNQSNAVYTAFVAGYSGTVTGTSVAVVLLGGAANMKCAIHADNGSGSPGAILASATSAITPVVGTNAFTFSPGVTVTKGVQYWIGAITDTTTGFGTGYATTPSLTNPSMAAMAYSTFPQANPILTVTRSVQMSWTYASTPANWQAVSEAPQDGTTSFVNDGTVGHADLYGISVIPSVPASTIAVTTRGYMQKSDAGTRAAAVQIKSGSTTVATPTLVLSPSGFQWTWRMDLTDPNTGAAWTAAAVNAAQIGPTVIS